MTVLPYNSVLAGKENLIEQQHALLEGAIIGMAPTKLHNGLGVRVAIAMQQFRVLDDWVTVAMDSFGPR
jgi:hypothetical protein